MPEQNNTLEKNYKANDSQWRWFIFSSFQDIRLHISQYSHVNHLYYKYYRWMLKMYLLCLTSSAWGLVETWICHMKSSNLFCGRVLTSLHEAVQQAVAPVREPVPCHGRHRSHENRRVNHISLSSQRGQSAEHHPEEHLLQHLHLIILDILEQTFLLNTCAEGQTLESAVRGPSTWLRSLCVCVCVCVMRLTGRLLLRTHAVASYESFGTVAAERALCVGADLIQTVTGKYSVTTFIYIWVKERQAQDVLSSQVCRLSLLLRHVWWMHGNKIQIISLVRLPKHLCPVSVYPEAHFLQRAGPLPIQPTQAGLQSEGRATI